MDLRAQVVPGSGLSLGRSYLLSLVGKKYLVVCLVKGTAVAVEKVGKVEENATPSVFPRLWEQGDLRMHTEPLKFV
jgi:hypothetical protein